MRVLLMPHRFLRRRRREAASGVGKNSRGGSLVLSRIQRMRRHALSRRLLGSAIVELKSKPSAILANAVKSTGSALGDTPREENLKICRAPIATTKNGKKNGDCIRSVSQSPARRNLSILFVFC